MFSQRGILRSVTRQMEKTCMKMNRWTEEWLHVPCAQLVTKWPIRDFVEGVANSMVDTKDDLTIMSQIKNGPSYARPFVCCLAT